jgi:hypothetical protein
MAYFAEIDVLKRVTRVIAVYDEDTQDDNGNEVEEVGAAFCNKLMGGGTWLQTSYNTYMGIHKLGGTPFRVNYAGPGFTYDATKDAFIPPQPYPSWVLDEDICQWEAPIERPEDVYNEAGELTTQHQWNEDTGDWDEI